MSEISDTASRLCAACGMCCNGVLFYSICLQPTDSARKLANLGLRAKSRRGGLQILQPCPAHREDCCTIYPDRPVRCREFNCRQLVAVADGSTSESEAMEKINAARALVGRVRELLYALGDDREHRAISTRVAAIFTPPLEPGAGAEALRASLRSAMRDLDALLDREFRIETGPSATVD